RLPRAPVDVAARARGARAAQMGRLRASPADGQAAAPNRVARTRSSTGRGESHLGLPADPWGVAQARPRRLGDRDPDAPATSRTAAGAPPGRALLAGIPARPRRGGARVRLRRRRDRPAADP